MHPINTLYRIAEDYDYDACYDLAKVNGRPPQLLCFPTVVAERDDEIVGFLSSNRCSWCIMAGPLEMINPSGITAMRLLEAYENCLHAMGVTRYCFTVANANLDGKWLKIVQTFFTVLNKDDSHTLFERILSEPLQLAA